MSYTFGYIREATQAHIDLDEQETQAMNLQERYHIFANEAMQAICAIKPKYDYFKARAVHEYWPLINLGNNEFRKATMEEIMWQAHNSSEPDFADEIDTKQWYEGQNIYLLQNPVKMPEDFIAFADKQAWAFILGSKFSSENFVTNRPSARMSNTKEPATKDMYTYSGRNTLTFLQEGEYWIPYKGIWHRFKSGIDDHEEIDMPIDILLTIPLYVASICLQLDHAQRAMSKRAEFETALARVTTTDFLDTVRITPTFK